MSITLTVPSDQEVRELKPRIVVVGVGGAGGNAVNDMIESHLEGVEFLVANTDAQAINGSRAERKVQMGGSITSGLGAGARPDVGRAAAEESLSEIMEHLDGANMAFIAAGMGGGTGTGGAPVIARQAKEQGILTVGVVTKPFHFEGIHRMRIAEEGIEDLEQYVDTLIVIPNQNLFRIANEKTTFAEAFHMADQVLYSGVRGVTDLMVMPGLINLDFADIRSVMSEMGKAMMGTGEAEGERRALDAAEAAIANPLLDDTSMKGARGVLINITGGTDMTLFEVDEAANRIRAEVDQDAYIIFGSAFDESLEGRMRVSVVATGIDNEFQSNERPTVLSALSHENRPVLRAVPDSEEVVEAAAAEGTEAANTGAEAIGPSAPGVQAPGSQAAEASEQGDLETMIARAPDAEMNDTADATTQPEAIEERSDPGTDAGSEAPAVAAAEAPAETGDEGDQAAEPAAAAEAPAQPAAVQAPSAPEREAPTAMPAMGATDTFIPPAPASRDGKPKATPTKPFALTDLINGSRGADATVKEPETNAATKRGNLIDRIMGKRKSETASQPLDWKQERPADKRQEPLVKSMPAANAESARSGGGAQAAAVAQGRLGGLDPADRVPQAESDEDLLDIPAFLRRQAN